MAAGSTTTTSFTPRPGRFFSGRGGRGPSALTGAIEKGTGPGMARSGAGRRNPNMSGPSRTEAQTPAARHGRQPSGIACGRDWALGLGRLPREPGRTRRDGGTAGCGWRAWRWQAPGGAGPAGVNRDRRHGVDVRYTHKTIDAQAIYPTYSVNITHHVRCSTFNASFTTCRSLRPFPESHMQ